MNNKVAAISAFLGGVKNRYIQYEPDRSIEEKIQIASRVTGLDGLELCYPADFGDVPGLSRMLSDANLGISGVNVRSRRSGGWLRGAFTSQDPSERSEVIDTFRFAMDAAHELGCDRITTCPLNDGHDNVFELDYFDAYRYCRDSFAAICEHDPSTRVCIEYKINDPRTRCLLGTAGETLAFCQTSGVENLGATLDFGHSILAGERPAQALVMLHEAGRLFYVHVNDNDRNWDWDMLPAMFNLWELVEFFYYLRRVGYTNDWYAYDVMTKEMDTARSFSVATKVTRLVEAMADRIDDETMADLLSRRDPAASFEYLADMFLVDRTVEVPR